MRTSGTLLCLGSGAAFGAMGVFGKLAYAQGATVGTLLSVRFALATVVVWGLVLARPGARRRLRALPARDVAAGLALGLAAAVVYTTCILVGEGLAARVAPGVLSALVCTGAAVSLAAARRCSARCAGAR